MCMRKIMFIKEDQGIQELKLQKQPSSPPIKGTLKKI